MKLTNQRKLILDATKYRSGADSINSVYMGSMALASLYCALGKQYGRDSLEIAIATASEIQIQAALKICAPYIEYMIKYPTKHCQTCGNIMPSR